jgi:hypothetical protein
MDSQYITSNNRITITKFADIKKSLPIGTYAIMYDPMSGYYLEKREDFTFPEKIYTSTESIVDRVIDTFRKINRGMGVLLSGPKGTGKTIEAKQICAKIGIPVIILPTAYDDDKFVQFIENINTTSIIFIDEFEKLYSDEKSRNFFLSIMDGTSKSRHLFLLTSNDVNIGKYFLNRPNRIRYSKSYDFLSEETIDLIVHDKLKNKEKLSIVSDQLLKIPQLSMDVLVSILEECNLYDEIPSDFINFFNVEHERPSFYSLVLRKTGYYLKNPETNIYEVDENTKSSLEDKLEMFLQGDTSLKEEILKYYSVENREYKSDYTVVGIKMTPNDKNPTISTDTSLIGDYKTEKYESIYWIPDEIVSFKENRKGFEAVHINGSVLIGRVRPRMKHNFAF